MIASAVPEVTEPIVIIPQAAVQASILMPVIEPGVETSVTRIPNPVVLRTAPRWSSKS